MTEDPLRFEMDRLVTYDEDSILAEMRRVAALLPDGVITRKAFDSLSRVSSYTCLRRFGGWEHALTRAGLGDRYGGGSISAKMRDQRARSLTRDQVVDELQRISALLGRRTIKRDDVLQNSDLMGERVVLNRFGSWTAALEAAGLETTARGRRWTDADYFENLLAVWTHHGRVPTYAEMGEEPSRISPGGYAAKFGSWGRAKAAFVEQVNSDIEEAREPSLNDAPVPEPRHGATKSEDRREISLGLRYAVLRRDRFRCVTCGRSPATDLTCTLHVDHIHPFSKGGKTREDNLRTLCEACNLGKSDGDA